MDNYVSDYLHYNSGNMVPKQFHMWSALSTLACSITRKVHVDHGYFQIYPNLYICLIGRQGLRKSTAKNVAKDILIDAIPDYPFGASVQSREDIVKRMAGPDWLRKFRDHEGAEVEHKPVAFFINEFKNFLSINPGGMIEFLTDIYDQKYFDSGTIKHGLDVIINPCVNILACETPKWIIRQLKEGVISGGFTRRLLMVYITERPERITFPAVPPGGEEARQRCIEHLKRIDTISGVFQWESNEVKHRFDLWFRGLVVPEDEILEGYYEAKDVLVIKIAMLLALADYEPRLVLTQQNIDEGIVLIESLEANLSKLTIGAGRNELAVPMQKVLELLEQHGGHMPYKRLQQVMAHDLSPTEQMVVFNFLSSKTDQVVIRRLELNGGPLREYIMLPEVWADVVKQQQKDSNG